MLHRSNRTGPHALRRTLFVATLCVALFSYGALGSEPASAESGT